MVEEQRGPGEADEAREDLALHGDPEGDEASAGQEQPQLELLGFMLGAEEYAFNVLDIREIIKYQAVTFLPRCPAYILGVISLRGEIVPTLDLRHRLGLGAGSLEGEAMIVIVRHGEESVGFLVEEVTGVIKVRAAEVEPAPEIISPDKAEFLSGVIRTEKRLVAILNIAKLLEIAGDFA